jgi:hypothetical protein
LESLGRKEAAYKIYNRAAGVRGYFPLNLVCVYENTNSGPCYVMAIPIYQTEIVRIKIHTIAVTDKMDFEI